mgnify:CR=1 FL=1
MFRSPNASLVSSQPLLLCLTCVVMQDRELVLLRQRQARLTSAAQALKHAGIDYQSALQFFRLFMV